MNIDFVKAIYLLFPYNEMMTKNMEVFWLCLMCLCGLRMSSRATQNWKIGYWIALTCLLFTVCLFK